MYPRISRVSVAGKTYSYLRLVRSVRNAQGRICQEVVANLGRLDQIQDHLDGLILKLRKFSQKVFVLPGEIRNRAAVPWGPVLVARHLYEELFLDRIIEGECQGDHQFSVAESAFVLLANRLDEPRSEHGMARWLEHTYVCDRTGKRLLPRWLPEEVITKEHRVKVNWEQLESWYRTLDALYAKKKEIEKALFLRLRDLLHFKVDLVFYDLTSVYFERREPRGALRRHGHSRDGKPRNVQVLLGMVMVAGFPIASHVFRGNQVDKTTVAEVLRDLQDRFQLRHVIFVGDKGMVSPANVEVIESLPGYAYLFGHPGRRDADAQRWLKQAVEGEKWTDCGRGTRVQEVESGKEGLRTFVVESEERLFYERQMRARSMARAEEHLKKVARAVEAGRLRKPDKIGARAARALQRDKGYRYFTCEIEGERSFAYRLDDDKLRAETLHEGRYILTTNNVALSPVEGVRHYKELTDVEDGFRCVKDVIEGRPVYHKKDERVCAHLFVAQLGLLMMRQLRYRLDQAGLPLSAPDALAAVKSVGVAELDLNGERHVLVSDLTRDARRVLKALGIANVQPPGSTRTATGQWGGKKAM